MIGCRFWFGISLRSVKASKDWAAVCHHLEQTLRNLLAQTDERFRVVLACHEVPPFLADATSDVRSSFGDRLNVLSVASWLRPPRRVGQFSHDKWAKTVVIGSWLRESGADDFYFMHLDADDFVRNDLVASVLADDNRRGYLLTAGYFYDSATGEIALCEARFDQHCGSSAILYFSKNELPKYPQDEYSPFSQFRRHARYEAEALEWGKPLQRLTEPLAIYNTNHGDNNRIHRGLERGKIRFIERHRVADAGHFRVLATRFAPFTPGPRRPDAAGEATPPPEARPPGPVGDG